MVQQPRLIRPNNAPGRGYAEQIPFGIAGSPRRASYFAPRHFTREVVPTCDTSQVSYFTRELLHRYRDESFVSFTGMGHS